MSAPRSIVIIGGGIIGSTTAYYLSRHAAKASITVLEASAHGAAQGASGKAGGLVARWAYPKELVDISFDEHVRLAEEHGGKDRWGFRFVGCGSWEGRGEAAGDESGGVGKGGKRKSLEKITGYKRPGRKKTNGLPDDLDWVKESLTDGYSPMSAPEDTAQVHPYLFTTIMLDLAVERGAKFVPGKATSIDQVDGRITGVTYIPPGSSTTATIPATDVVLAAGAWSPSLLPGLPISATRAHSITIKADVSPYVLFTEITLPQGSPAHSASPEIYARPGGEVYACGPGDDSALPESVDDVQVDLEACETIREHVSGISPQLREASVDKRQACFLPVVRSGGGPIVGKSSLVEGLYIATGHTCWGICNAPGTAKAVTELIMDGKVSCTNLNKLDPSRFL